MHWLDLDDDYIKAPELGQLAKVIQTGQPDRTGRPA
jgi:hypothetical protein